ncbi:unnamed protein product [Rhizoctonia solani]|uniref:Uncharacterized protein n=1 Tax=Rhizoctonia solani TaxID=456999 RepID=A0A8H3HU59_9AGAM|nr:unnamed protein product [Rhizoctonia solani]
MPSKKPAPTTPASPKAPKRRASATPVAPQAPKRAKRVTVVPDSSDEEPSPGILAKAKAIVVKLATPKSMPKSRAKTNGGDTDDDEDDEDDAAAPGKKKPSVVETDAFSRGFFRGLAPATDAYYNKESNLIRLQCAEYDRAIALVEATIRLIDGRKFYLVTLRESEAKIPSSERPRFRKTRADEVALGVMRVEKDRETIQLNMVKFQSDMEIMRRELVDREKEYEEMRVEAENSEEQEELDKILGDMLNGGA